MESNTCNGNYFPIINKFINTIEDDFANARCNQIISILSTLPVNLPALSSLIPFEVLSLHPSIRSLCWKAFSNYYPSSDMSSFHSYYESHRSDYNILKNSLTLTPESIDLIKKDLQRTRSKMHFLQQHPPNNVNETNLNVLHRMLHIFRQTNSDIGYHQGMNEIAFIFYYCFSMDEDEFFSLHAEEDAYWCFNNYIQSLKNVYTCKEGKKELGVMEKLEDVQHMLKILDPQLNSHLEKENVVLNAVMMKWYFVGLIQNFSIEKAMEVFDNIIAEQKERHLILEALCLSVLKSKRTVLLNIVNDINMKIYHELNHLNDEDVEEILKHVKKIISKIKSILVKEKSSFIFC